MFDKSFCEKYYSPSSNNTSIDTLLLIGNGFDIWQGLNTSYAAFEQYYYTHLDEVLTRLGLSKKAYCDNDGKEFVCSDVEIFYGDPKNPCLLPHEFWADFEKSLDKIDDQQINAYFGRSREGVRAIKNCAQNAQSILREIFSDWVQQIELKEAATVSPLRDHCLVVNFNYTETLEKRFFVPEKNIFHIHGTAREKESIIFGHATHPELPFEDFPRGSEHPRFEGLYSVEEFLYQSDKHVEDRYMQIKQFLSLHGITLMDINHIYVLGLRFGDADLGYIRNLINDTQAIVYDPEEDMTWDEVLYLDGCDRDSLKMLNLNYAIAHRERVMKRDPISFPEYEEQDKIMNRRLAMKDPYYAASRDAQIRMTSFAVRRRFLEEQAERDARAKKEFLRFMRKKQNGIYRTAKELGLEMDGTKPAKPPIWHVSYYSDEDRERITEVLNMFGCANYKLYSSIDECMDELLANQVEAG